MKVFVENIEPAWVRYTWEVEVPDDTPDDEMLGAAMAAIEGGDDFEISEPSIIGQIDGMDQEWKVTEVIR